MLSPRSWSSAAGGCAYRLVIANPHARGAHSFVIQNEERPAGMALFVVDATLLSIRAARSR